MKSEMKKDKLEILKNRKKDFEIQNFILVGRINKLEDSTIEFTQSAVQREKEIKKLKHVEGTID